MAGDDTASVTKSQIRRQRGPLNALVAQRMKELDLPNVVSFAEYAGLSDSAMYEILNGRVVNGVLIMPKWQSITKLAHALKRPTHEILYLLDPDAPGADAVIAVQQVPVFVAGCAGAGPEQAIELDEAVWVGADFAKGRDLVAFQIRGDSMAGGKRPIYDGDVVLVDRNIGPEVNQPTVVRLNGNGYVCKRLRTKGILDSANPDYQGPHAIVLPHEIAQIVGRVVRYFGTPEGT